MIRWHNSCNPTNANNKIFSQPGFGLLSGLQHRLISLFDKMPLDVADEQEQVQDKKGIDKVHSREDSVEALANLELSYEQVRKELTNKWLDYEKSCFIYLYRGGGEPSNTLAAFDLDGTIIKPKSNKRIPKSATDWQFFSAWTKVKLQQALRENEARLVIFTNQNGVGLKVVALEEVQQRIELVTKRLNIPCTVFVATEKDEFRKPNLGMFKLFTRAFNSSMKVALDRSFYCGDAVGYPSHSDADIKFAQSLKIPFIPPEKFVRGVKPKLSESNE